MDQVDTNGVDSFRSMEEDLVSPVPPLEGLMWTPPSIKDHQMTKLRTLINAKYKENLQTYQEFHRWSCDNYDLFWREIWDFCQVIGSPLQDEVIDKSVPINQIPKWFPNVTLNYAENLLRFAENEKVALYYTTERKELIGIGQMTFGDLKEKVATWSSALRRLGVGKGDRVAGYLPNCPEAIIAMAATVSIGAVWSSTSPDFGVAGVLDRFRQIEPKAIFSVEAVSYNMKTHDHLGKLREVVQGIGNCLEKVIIVPFCCNKEDSKTIRLESKEVLIDDFLREYSDADPKLEFEQVPT